MAEESKQREIIVTRQLHHSRFFFHRLPNSSMFQAAPVSDLPSQDWDSAHRPSSRNEMVSVFCCYENFWKMFSFISVSNKEFPADNESKHHLISRNPYKSRAGYFDFCSVQEQSWTQTLPLTYPTSAGPCFQEKAVLTLCIWRRCQTQNIVMCQTPVRSSGPNKCLCFPNKAQPSNYSVFANEWSSRPPPSTKIEGGDNTICVWFKGQFSSSL